MTTTAASTHPTITIPFPAAAVAWWAVACLIVAAFLCTMDRLVLNLLVDPIRADLNVTETQFSLLQGLSFTVVNSVACLPLGFLADKTSRRFILIFGVLVWSLATACGGMSHNFGQFLTARICVGMGEAALWPVAVSIIADVLPEHRRGRAVGLVLLGQILGSGASLILTGLVLRVVPTGVFDAVPVLAGLAPWRVVLVLWGALGILAIVLLLSAREPVRRPGPHGGSADGGVTIFFRHLWVYRAVMAPLYIGACCISIGSYSLAAWAPAFFIRHFQVGPGQIGPTLGIVGISAGIIGTSLAGYLCDRAHRHGTPGRKLAIMTLATLACLPGVTLVLAPTLSVAVVIQGISLLFYPIVGTATTVVLQDLVPNGMRGKAMAVLTVFSSMLGATLGPTLTAMVTQYIYRDDRLVGYSLTTVLLPALLIAAFCFYAARRALRHQTTSSAAGGEPAVA